MKRAGWQTARAPRGGRLRCRICNSLVSHGDAWNINERHFECTCLECKERAESQRDTGWRLLKTPHGIRFHREIGAGGAGLQLDVEEHQPKGWTACAIREHRLIGVRCERPSADEAAAAIAVLADVAHLPLPVEGGAHE